MCIRDRGRAVSACSLIDPPSRKRKNKVKSVITASATKEMILLAAQAPHESNGRLICSSHRSSAPRKSNEDRSTYLPAQLARQSIACITHGFQPVSYTPLTLPTIF